MILADVLIFGWLQSPGSGSLIEAHKALCSTCAEKGSSYLLSLITLTTESGSSVVEQWARYPEVAGSIPAQNQLFKNSQIS